MNRIAADSLEGFLRIRPAIAEGFCGLHPADVLTGALIEPDEEEDK